MGAGAGMFLAAVAKVIGWELVIATVVSAAIEAALCWKFIQSRVVAGQEKSYNLSSGMIALLWVGDVLSYAGLEEALTSDEWIAAVCLTVAGNMIFYFIVYGLMTLFGASREDAAQRGVNAFNVLAVLGTILVVLDLFADA